MKPRLEFILGAVVALSAVEARGQEWAWATIAGRIPEFYSSLAVDVAGNAYVNADSGTAEMPCLVKLDPAGNVLWFRASYGGALAVGREGNVYVAGATEGGSPSAFATFGDISGSSTSEPPDVIVLANRCTDKGMFLVKFDSAGHVL